MTPKTPTPSDLENRERAVSHALSAINVFVKILAIRLYLFLSLVGAFSLSIIATNNQNPMSAGVLVLYAFVTVLPLTILEIRNQRGG